MHILPLYLYSIMTIFYRCLRSRQGKVSMVKELLTYPDGRVAKWIRQPTFLRVRVPLGSFTFVCQLTILVRLALDFHYDAMDLYRKRQKKESTREKMNRESMVYWRNGGKKEISGNVKLIFGSNLSREMVLCLVSFSPNRNDRTLVENYPLFDISSEPGFFFIHYD